MTERRSMTALGVLQGLAVWLLTESWPDDPRWAAASASALYFVVTSALVLHMARTGEASRRLLAVAAGVGLAFGAVALWVGWQLPPSDVAFDGDDARVGTWVAGSAIALFVLGPFLQVYQQTGRARFPYPELYRFSWNNFFVAALGLLYFQAVWAVLLVWSQLFKLVGIDFFEDLFFEEVVAFAIGGGALGYGLAAARENQRVIEALRGITQTLFRAILPVLSGVSIAFLATLPFTGLERLFGAQSAATILLWWLIFGVVLLNAVYLDGSRPPPYAAATRRVVEAGVLVTPLLAGLTLYAVFLRVAQHGLTPDRVFAALLAGVLALYAVGYAAAVVRRGDDWLALVRPVNVGVAYVWIGLAFAVHSPLLDPIQWSLRDQLRRLATERVTAQDFDYAFLRFHLGWRGHEALTAISARSDLSPEARERVDRALEIENYWAWNDTEQTLALPLDRVDHALPWPEGLRRQIELQASSDYKLRRCGEFGGECLVAPYDLDGDGTDEELVFALLHGSLQVSVFARDEEEGWSAVGGLSPARHGHLGKEPAEALLEAVRGGRGERTTPPYSDLQVDDHRLRFVPYPH